MGALHIFTLINTIYLHTHGPHALNKQTILNRALLPHIAEELHHLKDKISFQVFNQNVNIYKF